LLKGNLVTDIRIAFIGAGRMGLTHIQNLAGIPGIQVRTVADVMPENAERAKAISKAERATTDIDVALTANDVDAVVISTPTNTHASLIEKAARAKKAIWCEKPVAMSLAETQHAADVVREMGVPVQMGFMRRFDPGYAAAKRKIDSGEIGRIEAFRALGRDTRLPPIDYLKGSGGIWLDMAVHDLDLARFLVGEVDEVSAWGAVLIDERVRDAGDIDTGVALLRFANGALGTIETARRSEWGYDIRTEVAGAKGKLVIEGFQKTPITHSHSGGYHGDHFELFPDRFEAAYRLELIEFFESLRTGRAPSPGIDDALETQRLALAVTKSCLEGKPVRVSDIRD
jgi:myo-inositol 2-dehydrogenase/D-chiro-inositol 1-dehydrogenase